MLPSLYYELSQKRVAARWRGYKQPEDFGYDFREWVSPYTKGAHSLGGIAVVLQDWSSEEALSLGVIPAIQIHGRNPDLKTNKLLDRLLQEVLSLSIKDTYATNIFPFIKAGGISSPIPKGDVFRAAQEFAALELKLARPTKILALGRMPTIALREIGINCIGLPHPAARISFSAQKEMWRQALSSND